MAQIKIQNTSVSVEGHHTKFKQENIWKKIRVSTGSIKLRQFWAVLYSVSTRTLVETECFHKDACGKGVLDLNQNWREYLK